VPYLTRSYPLGAEFAHVVGYVGRIDINEASRLDADLYSGSTHIGKTGIERSYEAQLHASPVTSRSKSTRQACCARSSAGTDVGQTCT
jgi:cell division protein FtsI/penicillin-binding protein 2